MAAGKKGGDAPAGPMAWVETESDRVAKWFRRLFRHDDHSLVIVGSSFVELQLERLLRAVLEDGEITDELLKDDRGSGTFSGKIKLAKALGLIPDEWFRRLNLLRRTRNVAAHTHEQFHIHEEPTRSRVSEMWNEYVDKTGDRKVWKVLFGYACFELAMHLNLTAAKYYGYYSSRSEWQPDHKSTERAVDKLVDFTLKISKQRSKKAYSGRKPVGREKKQR